MHALIAFSPGPWTLAALALLVPLLAAMSALVWRSERARRSAEARAAELDSEVAAQTRHLHLCAQELHGMGLALLGQAAQPAAPEGSGRALLCLAADLQDVAARGAGPRVLRPERVDFASLLESAIDQVAVALAPGQREWSVAPELRQLGLWGDKRALRGALAQVLTRAVRHTREGDVIALRLCRAEDSFAILVEDEGAGLGAGDLGPALAQGGTRGLGLGLAVARQLMQAHEGELTIEALRGVGARAWMTLPRSRMLELSGS
ncbi:ATP-binding protein [Pseudoroseomonas globiformis]|uniref:histidine kinase n=1 Tax=Teichococcus globiformis TaxID=2307229 RepID=A0ABV7FX63_9PROT